MVNAAIWIIAACIVVPFVIYIGMLILGGSVLALSDGRWKVALWILVIAICGLVALVNNQQEKNETYSACSEKATAASVQAYPYESYPDTYQRGQLQTKYKNEYIRLNCY